MSYVFYPIMTASRPASEFLVHSPTSGQNFLLFYSGYSPLSNFNVARFRLDGKNYKSVQQYVESNKALNANRKDIHDLIMREISPRKCYELAVEVDTNEAWEQGWKDIMQRGIKAKFEQSPRLKQFLLDTGTNTIVFTSVYDDVLGIGLDKDHEDVADPKRWKGLNLLGEMLMWVRRQLTAKKEQSALQAIRHLEHFNQEEQTSDRLPSCSSVKPKSDYKADNSRGEEAISSLEAPLKKKPKTFKSSY